MTLDRLLGAFVRTRRASAAIEFAFVVPVMLLFIGGIVEFGRAYQAYNAVNQLATRYALAYADCSDNNANICQTELNMYTTLPAMQNLAPQLTNTSSLSLRMFQVSVQYPAGTVSITYGYPSSATLTAAEIAAAQSTITVDSSKTTAPQTGVIVSLAYTHQLIFFQTIMSKFINMGTSSSPGRQIAYTVVQKKS